MFSRVLPFGSILFLLLILGPSSGTAQTDGADQEVRPRGRVAFNLLAGRPVGEFANAAAIGLGWDIEGSLFWKGSDRIALRAALGGVIYGWEREKTGTGMRRTTTNDLTLLQVGPEYSWPLGNFRPFVHASVGITSFVTTENEKDSWWRDGTETQILGDYTGSMAVGAGLDVKVREGSNPVLLTLGGDYHRNGSARYLTEGAAVHNPDGSLTMHPSVTQANLVTFRIGAAFMFDG